MVLGFPDDFDPIEYINTPRWQKSRLGLERIDILLTLLGRPQEKLKFIHVAGTNGKGSTCAYIARILQAAGLRVGLFTSPYIERFEERIQINGQNISHEDLTQVTAEVYIHAETMGSLDKRDHPTEFELMTAVAFTYFAQQNCDIVVCEVGLGGRLDSTNVIPAPEVAVITRIGLDHTSILGDTLGAIAHEKAGIIKRGSWVVSYPQEPDAMKVVQAAADAADCTLVMPDFSKLEIGGITRGKVVPLRQFSYAEFGSLETRLLGSYQPQNAALALEVIRALCLRGWKISEEAIREGIAATMWPGRFEVLPQNEDEPIIVIDGGHNPQGAAVLAQSLEDVFPGGRFTFIMGVMADKNYRAMLKTILPLAENLITVEPENPRALSAEDLAKAAEEVSEQLRLQSPEEPGDFARNIGAPYIYGAIDFEDAVDEALASARGYKNGVICAFGSLYAIADIKKALRDAGLSLGSV